VIADDLPCAPAFGTPGLNFRFARNPEKTSLGRRAERSDLATTACNYYLAGCIGKAARPPSGLAFHHFARATKRPASSCCRQFELLIAPPRAHCLKLFVSSA